MKKHCTALQNHLKENKPENKPQRSITLVRPAYQNCLKMHRHPIQEVTFEPTHT